MDAQGIDVAVLYPSIGLFVPYLPELDAAPSADACRSYNEWVATTARTDGRPLFAAGSFRWPIRPAPRWRSPAVRLRSGWSA